MAFRYEPPPTNVTSTVDVLGWVNSSVKNWFFPGALISLWFIIIIKMLYNPSNTFSRAFATSSFMIMILAVFCRVLNFVNNGFMTLWIVLTIVGAVWMHFDNT